MNLITLRNHVTIHGQGSQVIVMAHGFGCDQTLWYFCKTFRNTI